MKVKDTKSKVDRDTQSNGNKKAYGKQDNIGQYGSMMFLNGLYIA
jgi:hypothetical protein